MNAPDLLSAHSVRARLLDRLSEVRSRVSSELALAPEASFEAIGGEVRDTGDESVAAERTEVRNALIGRDVGEIGELEAALARLDAGAYGTCIECELEIDPGRLHALPAARRCGHCQGEFERRRGRN
jgi:RNA polymerase-binding transcription factor DksA